MVRSENITIQDIAIYGDLNIPNNDGIDIEDSNNTVITRCHIDTGDDAICPKSSTGPVYNLTVTNSWIRSKSSAIKFGSASWFEFKHFVFDNITIVDSHRGLAFQIRDGGNFLVNLLFQTYCLLLTCFSCPQIVECKISIRNTGAFETYLQLIYIYLIT